ncbi:Glutathione S-transferase 1 [Armadillidium vulgare]|nr:Glutathione S-transferase 1 [Armadillidium vulgare]
MESRAICTYLIGKYGKDDSLVPKRPQILRVAEIDRLLYFDMGTLYKRFEDYVSLHEALRYLEGFLKGHDFAVGNKLTVADYVLISSVETFIESGINISKYPSIRKWVYRCRTQMKGYERENAKGAKRFGSWVRAKLS